MNNVRTCIGCHQTDNRSSLVRVVVSGGAVEVDESASAPGRGAWLHPAKQCWDRAITRGAVARALRSPGVDTSTLSAQLTARVSTNE